MAELDLVSNIILPTAVILIAAGLTGIVARTLLHDRKTAIYGHKISDHAAEILELNSRMEEYGKSISLLDKAVARIEETVKHNNHCIERLELDLKEHLKNAERDRDKLDRVSDELSFLRGKSSGSPIK